jgi:hypothetical protein
MKRGLNLCGEMISKAGATSQDFCGNYWQELISCGEKYFHRRGFFYPHPRPLAKFIRAGQIAAQTVLLHSPVAR